MNDVRVPDTISERERAQQVHARLKALQTDALDLDLRRVAAGKAGNDIFDGDQTYDARQAELHEAQQAIVRENSDVLGQVEELVRQQLAAERAQAEPAGEGGAE